MHPVNPVLDKNVIEQLNAEEVTFAKNQPQYLQLPAVKLADGTVITRWHLSWWERLKIVLTGTLFLEVLTFNSPLQPIRPCVGKFEII